MASANNRTTKNSKSGTSSGKKTSNSRTGKVQEKKQVNNKIQQEAIILLLFCVAVMLFLCMINVINGVVGPAIKYFMLGLFGVAGYLVPIMAFVAICFKISNKGNYIATLKLVAGIVFVFMMGILLCHFTGMNVSSISEGDKLFSTLYHYQGGGGVLFGLVACLAFKGFGNAGSIVFAIIIGLICLVIITEKSFLEKIKSSFENLSKIREEEEYEEEEPEEVPVKKNTKDKMPVLFDIKQQSAADKKAKLDQKEEERILNTSSVPKKTAAASQKVDLEKTYIEEKKVHSKDDIHEITLLNIPEQKVIEKEDFIKPIKEEKPEIKIHNSMQEIFAAPVVEELSKNDFSEKIIQNTADDFTEPVPMEKKTVQSLTRDVNKEFVSLEKESKTPIKQQDAFGDTLRSEMPDPVTERTHQANAKNVPVAETKPVVRSAYRKPELDLLKKNSGKNKGDSDEQLKDTALLLQSTLKTFGVDVKVTDISQGPSVTRYELQLGEGIKVNKIVNLADDIKLNLAAQDIRIEAPIPGKAAVGIEIPNKTVSDVLIRDLLDSNEFRGAQSPITFAVGKDISGKTIVADIAKMPHMLIAGATGSGKSVCINTLIMSILYKAHPDDVKLIMIDPKVVELSIYNGIPHLMIPVVTDPRKASAALQWAVAEMTKRYNAFASLNCRDLKGFNQKAEEMRKKNEPDAPEKMPQIIVIVDELADLMMVASKEVEEAICRLAQLARAAGIHLIIATQRPSVDVITGLIKANMPSRVAFKVTSGVDSRTILDMVGAEKLLGKGDMLFYPQGYSKPLRVQGAFVSDAEVSGVVEFLKKNAGEHPYDENLEQHISGFGTNTAASSADGGSAKDNSFDDYFAEACRLVVDKKKASSGMLQRVYKIGFNRAARIIDQMEACGVVGPEEGTKPRTVLMNEIQLEELLSSM